MLAFSQKHTIMQASTQGVLAMSDDQQEFTGRAKGGAARAAKLTPEERSEIAAKAAKKRWSKTGQAHSSLPRIVGGFSGTLNLAGAKLPCAVIEGPRGIQRILTETGITNAILGSRSGASKRLKKAAEEGGAHLPIFLAPGQLKPFIDNDLLAGPLKPIDYLDGDREVRGYDASVITAVCNIWLKAREKGALQKQQLAKAQQAEIIMRALADTAVVALIDEATGYQAARPRDALQQYLEMIVRKELAVWAKKFPDEFYENIYRLRGWPWTGMSKNRYSAVAGYTRDLVYERMAPGLLKELEEKSPKDEKGQRDNKLHQWLTGDVGDPMLASHLQSLLTLQRLAIANGWGWQKFMHMVDQVMKKKGDSLDLPFADAEVPSD